MRECGRPAKEISKAVSPLEWIGKRFSRFLPHLRPGGSIPRIRAPLTSREHTEQPSDETIAQRLREIFSDIEGLQNLQVKASYGVVTIAGEVSSPDMRQTATELARQLEGVIYVIDSIHLRTELESRLAQALQKIRQVANRAVEYLPLISVALAVLGVFWIMAALAGRSNRLYARMGKTELLQDLLRHLIRTGIFLIGLLIASEILGLTAILGAVFGAAGIIGLALGFGLKDIIENYLAGVLLSIRSPFAVKDWVSVGDIQGSVIRLTTRELVLMTLEGNHIRIPNSQVFKTVINNFTKNPLRAFSIEVGVSTMETLTEVSKVGLEALRAMKGVMPDPPPTMRIQRLGDYNVVTEFLGWVDQRRFDFLKVRSEAIRILKTALDDAGIVMPEPIQKVNLQQLAAAAEPPVKPRPAFSVKEAAEDTDVHRETFLDRQIEEDKTTSREENLLTDQSY
jgi:small conductance mechanosensitive channel